MFRRFRPGWLRPMPLPATFLGTVVITAIAAVVAFTLTRTVDQPAESTTRPAP